MDGREGREADNDYYKDSKTKSDDQINLFIAKKSGATRRKINKKAGFLFLKNTQVLSEF